MPSPAVSGSSTSTTRIMPEEREAALELTTMAMVSALGLVVTLLFGREDTEHSDQLGCAASIFKPSYVSATM